MEELRQHYPGIQISSNEATSSTDTGISLVQPSNNNGALEATSESKSTHPRVTPAGAEGTSSSDGGEGRRSAAQGRPARDRALVVYWNHRTKGSCCELVLVSSALLLLLLLRKPVCACSSPHGPLIASLLSPWGSIICSQQPSPGVGERD